MFGGKKQEKDASGNSGSSSPNANNIINTGTTVEGTITSSGDIRIDGVLVGDLDCKGKVILGPEGRIDGNVICQNAVIEGRFTGKINCAELLNIRETAIVNGDVNTDKLTIQSNAIFNVTCKMGGNGVKSINNKAAAS